MRLRPRGNGTTHAGGDNIDSVRIDPVPADAPVVVMPRRYVVTFSRRGRQEFHGCALQPCEAGGR